MMDARWHVTFKSATDNTLIKSYDCIHDALDAYVEFAERGYRAVRLYKRVRSKGWCWYEETPMTIGKAKATLFVC